MTENASPTQLSEPEDPDQLRDVVIQRLAIKAHLEAQQMQDLRKDLARRLRPSEGPFKAGDKVFYWDQDRAKIKSGHWLRGRVVAGQEGPMVSIDTGKQVLRVNETKLKKDHDEWHDLDVPLEPEENMPIASLVPPAPQDTAALAASVLS